MVKFDFEKSLSKLEQIVAEMEGNELKLDEMLAKFKEGMTLAEACTKRLNEAERTIEMLAKAEGGGIEKKPFPEEAGAGGSRPVGAEPDDGNDDDDGPDGELPF
ncbi:MAG: exodeoxyribonuclease VII small subunit [Verrucomicrobia bacterium]|nr:exodeoxyribonuclease VII small subunit [Verrucomicrobiota bacterium]